MTKEISKQQEKISLWIEGEKTEVQVGCSLDSVLTELDKHISKPFIGAKFNNEIVDINQKIWESGRVELLDLHSEEGLRIYRQSLVFLLAWAVYELYPQIKLKVKHSLGKSYYCELEGKDAISNLEIIALEAKMREIVANNFSIKAEIVETRKAKEILKEYNRQDTIELIESTKWKSIRLYDSGKYADFSRSNLVFRTGLLETFELDAFNRGFLLRFPADDNPIRIGLKYKLPKLAQVWQESEEWAGILGVRNLAGLLKVLNSDADEANNLIHIGEALHEKKIAHIADEIYKKRDKIELILIAGPSSSGKTTFAERLAIQLRVLGLRPISISTDDYFLDREHTPRDEYGDYDFEALEAVDIPLFNEHLRQIIKGKQVQCPAFNFHLGMRDGSGKQVRTEKGHPLIIEGIHSLNEKLTGAIDRENKYKIYISALTQIAIDDHNRINTTDTRLIRRIVRDSRYRSQDALSTLKRWPSVRRGEEKNIFPYQEEADIMFNSGFVYELSILKKYAYPLLKAISSEEAEFSHARHLLNLLDYVPIISDQYVPLNSILREFMGGSSIHGK